METNKGEKILQMIERGVELPTLPSVGLELMQVASQPIDAINLQGLASLLENDPTLAAGILRLANSPYFGLRRNVTRVSQAITLIGLEETVQLLNFFLLRDSLACRGSGVPEFSPDSFWAHSWATAAIARLLGNPQYLISCLPGELHMAGLLHDIGKIVLVNCLPQEFSQCCRLAFDESISLTEAEVEVFGVDHSTLGGYLLNQWNLPEGIVNAIGFHHDPAQAPAAYKELAMLVEFADAVAYQCGHGDPADPVPREVCDTWLHQEGISPLASPKVQDELLRDVHTSLEQKMSLLKGTEEDQVSEQTVPADLSAQVIDGFSQTQGGIPLDAQAEKPSAQADSSSASLLTRVFNFFKGH